MFAKNLTSFVIAVAVAAIAVAADDAPSVQPPEIEHIDLVHFSHTDYGFTDHPAVCRELQKRYLDLAIDAVLATLDAPTEAKFCWTAETIVAVDDWWQAATPQRRADFLRAVRSGQLEVAALPDNQTPTLDRRQWQQSLGVVPSQTRLTSLRRQLAIAPAP